MDQTISEIARIFGKLGGDATKKKYGIRYFKRLSKKAVEAKKKHDKR